MNIINVNKTTSKEDINACALLLLEQMDFIKSPSSLKNVRNGIMAALETPYITSIFAAKDINFEIVGVLFGNKGTSIEKAGAYFWINEFHIKTTERGKGIGTTLLQHVIDWCKQEKIKGISLATSIDNDIAKNLYTKKGFASQPILLFDKVF